MRAFLAACAAAAVVAAALLLPAGSPGADPEPAPAKPAPQGLKIIDQGQTDPHLKGYFTPEGVKVEIVADFPTVVNPVGMAFDDDGTLYVLEWLPQDGPAAEAVETVHYKDGSMRAFPTRKKKGKDRVKRLRDTKGNGTYDKAEVVLEDELPSGILLHDGYLYLAGHGTVRRYKPSKPGGPYEAPEVVARGFCAYGRDQVSGLALGNDGLLYITSGGGDNVVEGSDGSRATVLRTGGVFRCRPDGSRAEVYALGCVNPYGDVAFDAGFNVFHTDSGAADAPKFAGCRLLHVAEGSDYGWRVQTGAPCCRPDPVRALVAGDRPGRMPPVLDMGRGTADGLLAYNDTRFPELYRGLLLYPDAARRRIHAYHVEPYGATFAVTEEFDFLRSDDPLFRPCRMVVGPDGAMYVCDTRSDLGADRLGGDGKHGRIYRLTWAGTEAEPALPPRGMDSWAKIDRMAEDDLVKTLAAPDQSDRLRAQRALVRLGDKVRPTLLKLLGDENQPAAARIAALGALESHWNDEVEDAVLRRLDDPEADVRRLAADALGLHCAKGDRKANSALLQVLGDGNYAVRRAVALAMGRIAGPGAADDLVNALAFDEGKDSYLRDGLVRAVERLGKPGIDRLVALAESGVEANLDRAVSAFLALRTRPGADAIPALLKNPHLSVAQRAALVRSYGNYLLEPPVDLGPLVAYMQANPDEGLPVKQAALEVLALGDVRRGDKALEWARTMLRPEDPGLARGAVKVLGTTPEGAREAARAFLDKKLPPEVGPTVADVLRPYAARDAEAARLLKAVEKKE